MIVVLIIPTGLGAEIGGHAGDANPVAKLIGACCDTLITHPNVVNASDINEMPENCLYVDGTMIDRFIVGDINLKRRKRNKILLVVNSPVKTETINTVSAARYTIGADVEIVVLDEKLKLISGFTKNGENSGEVLGWKELVAQVRHYQFDALAIQSKIEVDKDIAISYFTCGGINPWGRIEAKASRLISAAINKPTAHAPIESESPIKFDKVVDPRIAAEMVSVSYLHCVLKGLNNAPIPTITGGISCDDIDAIILPHNCMPTSVLTYLDQNH